MVDGAYSSVIRAKWNLPRPVFPLTLSWIKSCLANKAVLPKKKLTYILNINCFFSGKEICILQQQEKFFMKVNHQSQWYRSEAVQPSFSVRWMRGKNALLGVWIMSVQPEWKLHAFCLICVSSICNTLWIIYGSKNYFLSLAFRYWKGGGSNNRLWLCWDRLKTSWCFTARERTERQNEGYRLLWTTIAFEICFYLSNAEANTGCNVFKPVTVSAYSIQSGLQRRNISDYHWLNSDLLVFVDCTW